MITDFTVVGQICVNQFNPFSFLKIIDMHFCIISNCNVDESLVEQFVFDYRSFF